MIAVPSQPLSCNGTGLQQQVVPAERSHKQRPASRRRRAVATHAFFGNLFKSDPSAKTRSKYQARVDAINALEPQFQAYSDDQLRAKTDEFKQRVQGGESLDSILPEAFAVRMQIGAMNEDGCCMQAIACMYDIMSASACM